MNRCFPLVVVSIFLLAAVSVLGQNPSGDFIVKRNGTIVAFSDMVQALADADVVFVGELHDHKQGHELELAILQALQSQTKPLALSLEMFERDVQIVVNEYLEGHISESAFLAASRPWPAYKTDYRPLVEFCKEKHLDLIAANPPRRYVNMVSRKGQESLLKLDRSARSYLPGLPYSTEIPKGYDEALDKVFDAPHNSAGAAQPSAPAMPNMPSVQNLKYSQMLWDTGMADSIASYIKKHRGVRVLQMNGSMHSDFRFGIADRLTRQNPKLKIMTITIKPEASYPNVSTESAPANTADFVIVTPVAKVASVSK